MILILSLVTLTRPSTIIRILGFWIQAPRQRQRQSNRDRLSRHCRFLTMTSYPIRVTSGIRQARTIEKGNVKLLASNRLPSATLPKLLLIGLFLSLLTLQASGDQEEHSHPCLVLTCLWCPFLQPPQASERLSSMRLGRQAWLIDCLFNWQAQWVVGLGMSFLCLSTFRCLPYIHTYYNPQMDIWGSAARVSI